MKIKKIEVLNYKAVQEQKIDLNGCSAIVIGGNNRGKTSMLRGVIDRMRGEKPEFIVKQGEEKGFNVLELTDGSRIEWKFTEKTEQITYVTKEGFKLTAGVLSQIGEKYFGSKFDIDRFLASSAREQVNILSRLIGIDLTELNTRYQAAYQDRTIANRELKNVEAKKLIEPIEVKAPDIDSLKLRKLELKSDLDKKNEQIRNNNTGKQLKYKAEVLRITEENRKFNSEQSLILAEKQRAHDLFISIKEKVDNSIFETCFNEELAGQIFDKLPEPSENKPVPALLDEPIYKDFVTDPSIDEIDLEIETAQKQETQFQLYKKELTEFEEWQKSLASKREIAVQKDKAVKDIEAEKVSLINKAKLPKEFTFSEEGIYYNGLPLTNNQLSSSAKYIAALKLNAMVLGEVRTMHFDASFLDKISLGEIQDWASENDLQLLIERPDFDGGKIAYQIIDNGKDK